MHVVSGARNDMGAGFFQSVVVDSGLLRKLCGGFATLQVEALAVGQMQLEDAHVCNQLFSLGAVIGGKGIDGHRGRAAAARAVGGRGAGEQGRVIVEVPCIGKAPAHARCKMGAVGGGPEQHALGQGARCGQRA
ncbi:hypothetical protein D3C72_1614100 [compost metagenome]